MSVEDGLKAKPAQAAGLREAAGRGVLALAAAWAAGRTIRGLSGDWQGLGNVHLTEILAVLVFTLIVVAVLGGAGALLVGSARLAAWSPAARAALFAAAAAGSACILYGTLVEPYRIEVSRVDIVSERVAGPPLRIVHLSDLHVRRWGGLEERLLERVRGLEPDLILLTGDYTAWPGSIEDAQRLLRELSAVAPTYASRGNSEFWRPLACGGAGLRWLMNRTERLEVRGTPVSVTGIDAGAEWRVWEMTKGLDKRSLRICLYHYPDLVPELGRLPYDLLLSGHTHGGQIRLPWLGALVSLSRAGTRYASGLFQKDGRSAFVTRGVGCESYGLPRMRFLCPPEVALIVLSGPSRPGRTA